MVNVWLVSAELTQLLPEAERGVFWSGNCYMVMYSYTCAEVEHSELFFWRGRDVSPLNFLTWRFDLSQLLMQMPQAMAAPAMFSQNEEPERFISLMEGMPFLTYPYP
tara:strand:- start:171 stop:491 length:321 start_codon:yes stop_codon:yes gene_type:complete